MVGANTATSVGTCTIYQASIGLNKGMWIVGLKLAADRFVSRNNAADAGLVNVAPLYITSNGCSNIKLG